MIKSGLQLIFFMNTLDSGEVFITPEPKDLTFDGGRLSSKKLIKTQREVPVAPGLNAASQMRKAGTSAEEEIKTRVQRSDLMKVLAKKGKSELWDKVLDLSPDKQSSIAEEIQQVYKNTSEAEKDRFSKALSRLEEILRGK